MAQMIPDEVPPGKSTGERVVFKALQQLPDDCIVYYEPAVGSKYPDFVAILPDHGLLVIECKGWRPTDIIKGDTNDVLARQNGPEQTSANPVRQAREYMYSLMDVCRKHSLSAPLVHDDGPHKGKFVFPFGYCVVMTQMSDLDMQEHQAGNLRTIFPTDRVVDAEELDAWGAFTTDQVIARLAQFFNPTWTFPRITELQINVLRAVIHPEVGLPRPKPADGVSPQPQFPGLIPDTESLRALDLEQERLAREVGAGHRLIFGPAGSGKTVVLLARARYLSEAYPTGRILVLCYNIVFLSYLRWVLSGLDNVDVYSFHGWAAHNGVKSTGPSETPEQFGQRLIEQLKEGGRDAGVYEAVLIDEGQDFEGNWFSAALLALKDGRNGDLLIVGDGAQTAYRRGTVSWKALGIKAQGRTRHLTRNYRNTTAIAAAALPFAEVDENDDGIRASSCDPKHARAGGKQPKLIACRNRDDEIASCVDIVNQLLQGQYFGETVAPLAPSDIGIVYRKQPKGAAEVSRLVATLRSICPVVWLNEPGSVAAPDPRQRYGAPGVKVQTMHSAKGVQYRALLLLFADQLDPPQQASLDDAQKERRLTYVALTRAEDLLVVTHSNPQASVVQKMIQSGAFQEEVPTAAPRPPQPQSNAASDLKTITVHALLGRQKTTKGNVFLECQTDIGVVAVWGDEADTTNITLVESLQLPARLECEPRKSSWAKHAAWLPQKTRIRPASASPGSEEAHV